MDEYMPVITLVKQEQVFDGNGRPMDTVRVEFKVGQHGPFSERVLKADFNALKIQQIMQATANTLRELGATSPS